MWFIRRRGNKSKDEATKALADAQKNLKKVQERGDEITSVVEALREIRERNHFAERMEEIIIRRRGSFR